jgi:hypothetical protein
MTGINIQVLIIDECLACFKVLQRLHQVRNSMPELRVEIFNLDERQIIPENLNAVIMPATYVNGQLFAYGDFEPLEFVKALQRSIK